MQVQWTSNRRICCSIQRLEVDAIRYDHDRVGIVPPDSRGTKVPTNTSSNRVVAFIIVLPMQETYKKIILTKRAKKLGIPGPPKPQMTGAQYIKFLLTVTLFRPVHMLITEPIVLFLSLYNSFTFSVLVAFFAAYPFTFEGVYGFTISQYGLAFLGILVGVLLAVVTAIIIDRQIYYKKYYRKAQSEGKGNVAPERRLYAAMLGSFGITIGLFWFGWTARPSIHWISPILAGIPFAWGNLSIFISSAL